MWLNIYVYIYTLKQNQNCPINNKVQYIDPGNQRSKKKKKLYVQEQKQQNTAQTGNKSKACSQFRNKAMKVKVANMLRRKERKERNNRFVKLNRGT